MKKAIEYLLLLVLLAIFIFLVWSKLGKFFCDQGDRYLESSSYKEAINSYGKAVRINPGLWSAHLGLAEAYRESGDYDGAIREYKITININPVSVKAYDSLAYLYSQNAKFEEALKTLSQAEEKIPGDQTLKDSREHCCFLYFADALTKSTELFLAQNNKEAIPVLKNVFSSCPGNALAYYTLGYYYFSEQDYSNAETNLNKAIAIDPDFYYAYKVLADLYFEQKDTGKALFYAQKAVSLGSKDASNYNDLGLLLMRLERYGEAAAYLKKAVSLDPNNADYIYSLGSVYRDNKMFDQAISEYNKIRVLKNDYPNLHNDLADIYVNLGRNKEAISEYQQEIKYCREKLKSFPNDPVALNNYAYALNGINEPGKAQEVAERLVSLYPRYREAYLTLSRIYEKMNKHALALKTLEKAKQLSGAEKFINDALSRLREQSLIGIKAHPQGRDWVYLKNGRKIQGRIKKEQQDKVILEVWLGSTQGELIFYRDSIERIEKAKD